jgi:hypothetical protein
MILLLSPRLSYVLCRIPHVSCAAVGLVRLVTAKSTKVEPRLVFFVLNS